jgi:hypothetical protein
LLKHHEDKDASFFIKRNRVEPTRRRFRNKNYVAEGGDPASSATGDRRIKGRGTSSTPFSQESNGLRLCGVGLGEAIFSVRPEAD